MGSDQNGKIICQLCQTSDETETTGPLSSKEYISAHQNCLLFASGIYCKSSPTYDDLFGFAVQDVRDELRRGKKLVCHLCGGKGATAGCDVKRCKRSYHYPCAIKDRARCIEESTEGRYRLFCNLHDPESKGTSLVRSSTSSSVGSKRRKLADSHGQKPDMNETDSSSRSSEASVSKKKIPKSPVLLNADNDIDPVFAPVESDEGEFTPPELYNQSTPEPESKGPRKELDPFATGSLNGGLISYQKACGSADSPGHLHGRRASDSPIHSPDVETPIRKKRKLCVYSDDEVPTGTDPVAPRVLDLDESVLPKQPNQSSPVTENIRPYEKLNLSTTGADDDDTDIDAEDSQEDSQSLLPSETYHITVPCNVLVDSGLSAESEYNLEVHSPVSAASEVVFTSPGFVTAPEHEETPSTSRTSLAPRAPTTDTVSPGSADSMPDWHRDSKGPSGQPESPQHSRPTVDVPGMLISAAQTIPAFDEQLREPTPPAGVCTSPDRAAGSDPCDVNSTGNSQSNSAVFWTACNHSGWTKEIFSKLVSQLSSLGERVQSQEASLQDYDVALKLLEASGQLPSIITQLEQDLERQEQDLQRKKAALRDARAVLGVKCTNLL